MANSNKDYKDSNDSLSNILDSFGSNIFNTSFIYLIAIVIVLLLFTIARYNSGGISNETFTVTVIVLGCILICIAIKVIKSNADIEKVNEKVINATIDIGDYNSKTSQNNLIREYNINDNLIVDPEQMRREEIKKLNERRKNRINKQLKKVRFNTPLQEYEKIDNYQKDFFTFRDTLYQNSSNDFDYADIMNQEQENMDSNKKYKGRIWDLYDDLTKPDYSKIPVKYDKNLDNAKSEYYPVFNYKGQKVRTP